MVRYPFRGQVLQRRDVGRGLGGGLQLGGRSRRLLVQLGVAQRQAGERAEAGEARDVAA